MAIKQTAHIIRGLRKDFSDSKQPKEYAIDAKNIRITNREDSTLLSITNEKGTKEVALNNSILGDYLGHTTINNVLVLFTRDIDKDYIYKINLSDNTNTKLFEGKLSNETIDHIEALGVYESEDIQKVYWVDGVSQPRMINIYDESLRGDVKVFDFIQELQLNENIEVEKLHSLGSFNSGVIQYAFNYYNKNGQESNIVEVTPINYISYEDRGAAPNDYVSNSFKITINNVDTNFDYLRLYSIHRTSLDAVPSVKLITDLKVDENTLEYIDTGITGETIDPVELLYKGGEYIIPKTLAQKDGTLFFGNIKLKNIKQLKEDVPPDNVFNESKYPVHYWRTQSYYKIGNLLQGSEDIPMFSWEASKEIGKIDSLTGYYPYKAYLNKGDNTTFQSRETYRLGIQFQDNTGKWSNPIFYNDKPVNKTPLFDNNRYLGIKGKLYITNKIVEWAISNNYKKVRPVVVYPQESEREIIAQGILCPTVFNVGDRREHEVTAQSSWFFRPIITDIINKDYDNISYGAYTEFRHGIALPQSYKRNAEIQNSVYENSLNEVLRGYGTTSNDDHLFGIDSSIVTFHSPEIELEYLNNIYNCKLRIIGAACVASNASDIDITIKNSAYDISDYGLKNYFKITDVTTDIKKGGTLISGALWRDVYFKNNTSTIDSRNLYMIYPWHKGNSLTNIPAEENVQYSSLRYKKISNLKYFLNNEYLNDTLDIPLSSSLICNKLEESKILEIPKNAIKGNKVDYDFFNYQSSVDKILYYNSNTNKSVEWEDISYDFNKGYPIWISETYNGSIKTKDPQTIGEKYVYCKEPITMKYKSSTHGLLVFEHSDSSTFPNNKEGSDLDKYSVKNILPTLGNTVNQTDKEVWMSSDLMSPLLYDLDGIYSALYSANLTLPSEKVPDAYMWIGELYREVPNKFGGNNYENNIWYPAGKSVRLDSSKDIYVEFTQGDTFFSRFDSLKTYSDDLEAVNSVTEIGSFMVETRINLDARYDRNRGKQSNLVMNPGNFNLFNDVYNQKNNFFNYRIIDKDIADNTKFPNTIVWSKQKFAGSDVDPWTNINMASSLDLDGTKGEITKLVSFKNEIFSFQPEAINHILFNSRVQIPTSDGVPIELTNAYKVDGARQLSNIGSSNPLAIKSTDRGIYYMDNITKGIYIFNGQQSESLSDKLGMNSWVKKQNIDSYKVNYDKINQDIYFINNDNCLSYSEKLGEFESFFDYNNSEIFNVKDGTYAINSNKLYKLFEGDYNRFFDSNNKNFWITFTHNENPFNDKIYNTLEFRADTWDDNYLLNDSAFNIIKVNNKYQDTNEVSLEFAKYIPSNLKRKFRIWRANIPRDAVNKRDRIRNTWANITLKASNPSNTKTELHDLVVSYFM